MSKEYELLQNCGMLIQNNTGCQNQLVPNTEVSNSQQSVQRAGQQERAEQIKHAVKVISVHLMQAKKQHKKQTETSAQDNQKQQDIKKCYEFVQSLKNEEMIIFVEGLYIEALQCTNDLLSVRSRKLMDRIVRVGNQLVKNMKFIKNLHAIVLVESQNTFFDFTSSLLAYLDTKIYYLQLRKTAFGKLDKENQVWQKNKEDYYRVILDPIKTVFSTTFIQEYTRLCRKFKQLNQSEKHSDIYQIVINFFELPAFEFFTKNQSLLQKHSLFQQDEEKDKQAAMAKASPGVDQKKQKPKRKKKKRNHPKKQTKQQKQDSTSITSTDEDNPLKNEVLKCSVANFSIMFADFRTNKQSRSFCYVDDNWLQKTYKITQKASNIAHADQLTSN